MTQCPPDQRSDLPIPISYRRGRMSLVRRRPGSRYVGTCHSLNHRMGVRVRNATPIQLAEPRGRVQKCKSREPPEKAGGISEATKTHSIRARCIGCSLRVSSCPDVRNDCFCRHSAGPSLAARRLSAAIRRANVDFWELFCRTEPRSQQRSSRTQCTQLRNSPKPGRG